MKMQLYLPKLIAKCMSIYQNSPQLAYVKILSSLYPIPLSRFDRYKHQEHTLEDSVKYISSSAKSEVSSLIQAQTPHPEGKGY
mgnify:FL=1